MNSGLVAQRQVRGNRDLAAERSDVLLDTVIVAIDEAVEIVAVDAEFREWATRGVGIRSRPGPVVRHAEIGQAVQIGVNVIRVQLHRIERRPFDRDKSAVAVILDVVAAGDAGILEQATGANRQCRADHLVDVEHDALGVIGAERGVHVVEAFL